MGIPIGQWGPDLVFIAHFQLSNSLILIPCPPKGGSLGVHCGGIGASLEYLKARVWGIFIRVSILVEGHVLV